MKGGVEGFAAATLREYLLAELPAVIAACNLTRAAYLKSPWKGPWVIGPGRTIGICLTPGSTVFTEVAITSGTRTAAQIAADIEAELPGIASADSIGRLLLTSDVPPSVGTTSTMGLRGGTDADINSLLGWSAGGEQCSTTAIASPDSHDVSDGLPTLNDFNNALGKGSLVVVIDEGRTSSPLTKNPHDDHYTVTLPLVIIRTEPELTGNKNVEHIHACVECVRTVLSTQAGRQLGLGAAPTAPVGLVSMGPATIFGELGVYAKEQLVSPLASYASMKISIRMYERPAQS